MVGLQGPRGSRVWPKGSQGVKGLTCRIPGGQGEGLLGLRGSRGRPTGSQRVVGGQEEDLEGPRGSRCRPKGSQGVKGFSHITPAIFPYNLHNLPI